MAGIDAGSIDRKEKNRLYYAKYREKNREKLRERNLAWYHDNKEQCLERQKKRRESPEVKEKEIIYARKYRKENRDSHLAYRRAYYAKNNEKEIKKSRLYREENREKYLESQRKTHKKNRAKESAYAKRRQKEVRENNSNIRIAGNLRSKMRNAMVAQSADKYGSFNDIVNCTPKELVSYLESLFTDGMAWENYGVHGWHIDHIKPCASFDLTDINQQKKCFNYKNLQPLWAVDNLKKGASVLWQHQ